MARRDGRPHLRRGTGTFVIEDKDAGYYRELESHEVAGLLAEGFALLHMEAVVELTKDIGTLARLNESR